MCASESTAFTVEEMEELCNFEQVTRFLLEPLEHELPAEQPRSFEDLEQRRYAGDIEVNDVFRVEDQCSTNREPEPLQQKLPQIRG
jgi:hypothetical protein